MEKLLKVRNLSIDIIRPYKGSKVHPLSSVENISFDIFPGEIIGIVGESGSGKSLTALSIMALLGEDKLQSGGSIFLENREINKLDDNELNKIRGKEISIVFQEPFSSLNPLMKIGRQIEESLELHGEKDRQINKNLAVNILKKMQLKDAEKLLNSFPHQLSGGMCQRIMIALAVICRPKLLIADEATTALDNNTQELIISLLREINKDYGTSILFISHDLSLIRKLCSRVLVMYSGRFLEEGDTEELFNKPAHEYTKSLLGAIPNRLNRGKALNVIKGRIPSLEEGRPSGCPFHPRCEKADNECSLSFPEAISIPGSPNSHLLHKSHCRKALENLYA